MDYYELRDLLLMKSHFFFFFFKVEGSQTLKRLEIVAFIQYVVAGTLKS